MNNNRGTSRRRGRSNNRPQTSGRSGGMDQGNRIDSRARGNATQMLEKYKKMAHDAQMNGDRVATEYYLQFADHYFRVLADNRARQDEHRRPREEGGQRDFNSDYADEDDDNGYGNGNGNGGYSSMQDSSSHYQSDDQNGDDQNDDGRDDDSDDTRGNSRNDGRQNDGRQQENRQSEPRQNDSRRERRPRDNRNEGRSDNRGEPRTDNRSDGRNEARGDGRNETRTEARSEGRNDPRPVRDRPERAPVPQSQDTGNNDAAPVAAERNGADDSSAAPRRTLRGRGRPPRVTESAEGNGLDPMILPPAIGIAPEAPASDAAAEAPKPKRRAAPRRKAAESGDVEPVAAES